jgi:hypothetical protein
MGSSRLNLFLVLSIKYPITFIFCELNKIDDERFPTWLRVAQQFIIVHIQKC